ncbi:hypothetical protein LPJ78_004252 [Coemansia sp. RSA 989]|nr:high mobility group box-domain-containing protein [Coemansia mojavensis]KAJ1740304.1 hypothetical protein LPJ68_003892 [Coemansia sp. RSA 1086]KAJ1748937.1 hypothetical protein LPJ79_004122 [Coemansia sp. RSA 1821]KAJ1863126.1 hypothetical protein LPJ78_004252 [Coemansia sp. RSA 989]KAJ1871867.1 hypothetical protein LPJ55_003561 [Coemansia sp. RSA 990]KAJ2630596.1 hypothetical protein H4R22_002561 [Coemansia sp. RSA 1290]KAJ2651260.1 hypothetical protein IWW40_001751 [Coemansia sp. RSA 125
MASISNIVSLQSSNATIASEGSEYTRASSTVSFPCSDDTSELRALSPASTFAASRGSSPSVSSLSAVLPSAANAAAASAAAEVNRRRKVLTSRPPNSFILYRSDKLRELVQKHPELKQTQISKMCADNWKKESPEVKEFYRRKQQEAKALFLSEQALEVERISGGSSDKGVIKRIQPTNTFIRYRTEMKKKLASQFATMNQKDVSRACGLMWRSEPEHVKMRYRQSYNKEKRDFERLCSSSTLSEQPSKEALSALAMVMAEASKDSGSVSASPSLADKKRRLSEGCRSAPVSPPQPEADNVRSKRLRSFHTPSRSESAVTTPTEESGAKQPISLPSCASLLSMAGMSSLPARNLSALSQPVSHFHKQPEHLRHAFQPPNLANHPASILPPPSSSQFYLPPPHHQMMPQFSYNVHN